jgi:hypothetical protein
MPAGLALVYGRDNDSCALAAEHARKQPERGDEGAFPWPLALGPVESADGAKPECVDGPPGGVPRR